VIPNLFGGADGIRLDPGLAGGHTAHFKDTQGFTNNFLPLGSALATQLALIPIASPASGFTYSFDSATGVHTRTAQSLGPILTERGETIGRKKFFFGFNHQNFRFERIDGQDLGNLPAVFTHTGPGRAVKDVMTLANDFRLALDQFTVYATFGLTNRLDVSVIAPFNDVRLSASSLATIRRYPTGADDCPGGSSVACHAFNVADRSVTSQSYLNKGSASGIGDVTLRFKHNVVRNDRAAIAVLTDVRLKTGDEKNFLGSGAVGVKPFVAASLKYGPFSPHLNVGYQWNGKSALADRVTLTGVNTTSVESHNLPKQVFYSAGADFSVIKRITFAADFLGQRLFDAETIVPTVYYHASDPSIRFPQLARDIRGLTMNNFAFGFKVNLVGELLWAANVVFRLDNNGLRSRPVPMLGLSYSF
jgi:hypothetical protein